MADEVTTDPPLSEQLLEAVRKAPGGRLTEDELFDAIGGDDRSKMQAMFDLLQRGALLTVKGGYEFVPEHQRVTPPGSDHVPDAPPDPSTFGSNF